MPDLQDSDWSETDASNNTAAPAGWADGALPSAVKTIGRMMMGALKRFWNLANPVYTTGGTSTVLTVDPDIAISAYATGLTIDAILGSDIGVNATLNASSLGAKNIYVQTQAGLRQTLASDARETHRARFSYDATLNSAAGGWVMRGLPLPGGTAGYVLTANGADAEPTFQVFVAPAQAVIGDGRDMAGATESVTLFGWAWTELVLKDASGNPRLTTAVPTGGVNAARCDVSLSGISGLDTGSEAGNTHYAMWAVDRTTPRIAVSVTASASTDLITDTAHGMAANTPVAFSGAAVPTGLNAGQTYYIRDVVTNGYKVAATPNGTAIDLTGAGASVTVSTVPAVILSASFTAPTMPSLYSFKALIGAVRNNGSANFITTYIVGRRAFLVNSANIVSGVAGPASLTALDVSSVIPPIAKICSGRMGSTNTVAETGIGVAGDANGLGAIYANGDGATTTVGPNGQTGGCGFAVPITVATEIFWQSGTTATDKVIVPNGWEF